MRSGLKSYLTRLVLVVLLISCPALTANATGTESELHLRTELKTHLLGLQQIHPSSYSSSSLSTSEVLDERIVLVTFFASWCPPCLDEFKALNEVQDAIGSKDIVIIAVNVFEEFDNNDEARMTKFLSATDPQFTVVKGTDITREIFGNINRIPTLFLFDRNGEQAFKFVHARNAEKRSAETDELLNAIKPLL